jgi:aminoglycoside 6-adenylyltransferase
MMMRSETEIKNLITGFANNDTRIRAVLLNGSRANPDIAPDKFRDFDIVFIVNDLNSFIIDHSWTNIFGDKIIWQLPGEMMFGNDEKTIGFGYLMLFSDQNRIDLTLFPISKFESEFKVDSLTTVWIDKDTLFPNINEPCNKDYLIGKPTQKEFSDTCNEFWWVSTYVAKGLAREEIIYAKAILETVVRPMFIKLIEWKIGSENNFSVSIGKAGKFIERYLNETDYLKVLATYADAGIQDNWESVFLMTDLFAQFANDFSMQQKFDYNKSEQQNVIGYLRQLYNE